MKRENQEYEKKFFTKLINILLSVFKWMFLVMCVIDAGLTISLLVMTLVKGNALPHNILQNMMIYLTNLTEDEVFRAIANQGTIKVVVAGVGYGFGSSLTYGLIYMLISQFKELFKSICNGNMFTKENMLMLENALPISLFITFISPLFIFCIVYSTKVFDYSYLSMSGIFFFLVVYILKLIFEKGYELQRSNDKFNKEFSSIKAESSELQIASMKMSDELKELKKMVKKTTKPSEKEEKEASKTAKKASTTKETKTPKKTSKK